MRAILAGCSWLCAASLLLGDAAHAGLPPYTPPPHLQLVGTHGQVPVTVDGAGTANYTRFEGRIKTYFGPVAFSNMQLAYFGTTVTQVNEQSPSADFGMESVVLYTVPGGSLHVNPMYFRGGQKNPTISAGSGITLTDPLPINFAAGDSAVINTAELTTAGNTVPVGQKPVDVSFDKGVDSTATASQTYENGTLLVPSGGAVETPYLVGPTAILGIPTRNYPSACIFGDSIAYGQQDVTTGDGNGNRGYIERGLWNVFSNGAPMPFANMSRQGSTMAALSRAQSPLHFAILPYCTDAIVQRGTNDITTFAAGTTTAAALAAMQASAIEAWTRAAGSGGRVWQVLITPHTADATNVAIYVANIPDAFAVGGLRDQFNSWVKTQVGVYLTGFIDPNTALESQTTHGLWASASYTFEGLHLTAAGYAAGAPVVNAWAKKLPGAF